MLEVTRAQMHLSNRLEQEQEAYRPEKLLLRVAGRRDQNGVVLVDQWFSPCS